MRRFIRHNHLFVLLLLLPVLLLSGWPDLAERVEQQGVEMQLGHVADLALDADCSFAVHHCHSHGPSHFLASETTTEVAPWGQRCAPGQALFFGQEPSSRDTAPVRRPPIG